jgi:hypothetical protein
MNTLAPPGKETGALRHAPIPESTTAGYGLARHNATRCCVSCGRFIGNSNVGGDDGRPLSGRLWCLRCADRRYCER